MTLRCDRRAAPVCAELPADLRSARFTRVPGALAFARRRPAPECLTQSPYQHVRPPSTTRVAPVMNEDSSDARNRAAEAISLGLANLPMRTGSSWVASRV